MVMIELQVGVVVAKPGWYWSEGGGEGEEGKGGSLVVFDRSQCGLGSKVWVDLGLGCGLFVIWAQSVDQASVLWIGFG